MSVRFPRSARDAEADPWPAALPRDSLNVPTRRLPGRPPGMADRQLDYVFASRGFADRLSVRALNDPEEWGRSDHCRIEMEFSQPD